MKTKSILWLLLGVMLCVATGAVYRQISRLKDLDDGPSDTPSNSEVLAWNSTSGRAEWTASGGVGENLTVGSLTVTNAQTNLNVTASRAAVFDADKRLTNSTVTATELGYVSGVTSALQTQVDSKLAHTSGTSVNQVLSGQSGITAAGNLSVIIEGADPTNVVNFNIAVSTNILSGALTMLHATNGTTGAAQYEKTHVRWLWAGGADRAFAIPAAWKTNVNSAVPANITNGTITVMYVKTIGNVGTAANQSNVFVSFEYYK